MANEPRRPDAEASRARLEREVREELSAHMERLERSLAARGMSPDEARAEARRRFGDPERSVRAARAVRLRALRDRRRREMLGGLAHDLRSAWRALAARPGFAVTAVLMLAIGSGAAVTTFSVLDGLLLSPLPFREPHRLYRIRTVPESLAEGRTTSADQLLDWHWLVEDAFAELSLYHPLPHAVNLSAGGEPLRATATEVSADFFTVLGASMAGGRAFGPGDVDGPTPAVVVISERLWRGPLGGDPEIVGGTLHINGNPYRVTGVVSAKAALPEGIDVWSPISFEVSHMLARGARFFNVLARARPGVTPEQAAASVARFDRWLEQQYEGSSYADLEPEIRPLQETLVSRVRAPLWLLLAATGLVLTITTANVAGYLLARAHARRGEYAVRAALGASARRLITQSLGEGALLAAGGSLLGLLLAWWCIGLLRGSTLLALPRAQELSLDGAVVGFSLLLTTLVTLGSGLGPALTTLRSGRGATERHRVGHTLVGTPGSTRSRDALLVLQVALALVLAVSATVLGQSWAALFAVDTGFDDDTVTFSVILDDVSYPTPESRQRFSDTVLARLRANDRIDAAGASRNLPMSGDAEFGLLFSMEDAPEDGGLRVAMYLPVTPGYLEATGIRVLGGRSLTAQDEDPSTPGMVVNEVFVDRYLGGRRSEGTRVQVLDRDFTIVGVAENVRRVDLRREVEPAFYIPAALVGSAPRHFVVHGRDLGVAGLATIVREAVRAVDPTLPVSELRTLGHLRSRQLAGPGLLAGVFLGFAGLGLALAAFGLYAVLTQWAVARTTETGLRMALGATRSRVIRHFVGQGAVRCGLGLLAGAGLYALGARWLESQLFTVRAFDPTTLTAVGAILTGVWLLAMLVPARRAGNLDPARALRRQ